jgi:hypothetical protein
MRTLRTQLLCRAPNSVRTSCGQLRHVGAVRGAHGSVAWAPPTGFETRKALRMHTEATVAAKAGDLPAAARLYEQALHVWLDGGAEQLVSLSADRTRNSLAATLEELRHTASPSERVRLAEKIGWVNFIPHPFAVPKQTITCLSYKVCCAGARCRAVERAATAAGGLPQLESAAVTSVPPSLHRGSPRAKRGQRGRSGLLRSGGRHG